MPKQEIEKFKIRQKSRATCEDALKHFKDDCKKGDFDAALKYLPELTEAFSEGCAPPDILFWLSHLAKRGLISEDGYKSHPVVKVAVDEFFDYLSQFNGSNTETVYLYDRVFDKLAVIEMLLKVGTTEVGFADWKVDGQSPFPADSNKPGAYHHDGEASESLHWVMRQCRSGQPDLLNPATGQSATSVIGVGPFLTLMRCSDEVVLACTEHEVSHPFSGCSAYLLVKERVFLVSNKNSQFNRKKLLRALRGMMSNAEAMLKHASKHARPDRLCPIESTERHIGHYAWNVLPVWSTLLNSNVLDDVTDLAYWSGGHVFGEPTALFPELSASRARIHELADLSAAFRLISEENVLFLPMQERYISRNLANRIIRHAKASATKLAEEAMRLRTVPDLIIMLTIRCTRRTWVDQQAGYTDLINRLHQAIPDTLVYIDGATNDNLASSTHIHIDPTAETEMAEAIKKGANFPDKVVSAVGVTMADSIVISDVIDLFVAPAGSGMTKYKWITNKPGIAHANHAVLDPSPGLGAPLKVWDHNREDIIPAEYLKVDDVENLAPAPDPKADYKINQDALCAQVLALARFIVSVKGRSKNIGQSIRVACEFRSAPVPPYLREARSVEELLPWLYLRGTSTGDFSEALAALLGPDAAGLSASTITRLKATWWAEYEAWRKRDLKGKRYVYIWADGVYFMPRLDDDRQCMLVIIGADEYGEKDVLAIMDGFRENADSWRDLLKGLKKRGLTVPPELAIGDGALGFWTALRDVFPDTREQLCWIYKTANVIGALPISLRAKARSDLQDIWRAETRKEANAAFDLFIETYDVKYERAVERLVKDRDELLTFYDFPAEHWDQIRTTYHIKRVFATVRRTRKTRGCLDRKTALAMVFRLMMSARKKWRKISGPNRLPEVIQGVEFKDGIKQVAKAA